MVKKHLDILIGNSDLALQPACKTGYGCRDCAKGRCLFRSKFGSGYIPLGSYSPIYYIRHHDVYKPGSLSTPIRLVSNSSFKNGTTNLNDLTVEGLNTLADIYENLFKFRSYQVALIFDISKAYNSIRVG